MKVINLRVNHMQNPLGFHMDSASFQWEVVESKGTRPVCNRLMVSRHPDMAEPDYDSGDILLDAIGTTVPVKWKPSTRYYWTISVTDDAGETAASDVAWFETPKTEKKWVLRRLLDPIDTKPVIAVRRLC